MFKIQRSLPLLVAAFASLALIACGDAADDTEGANTGIDRNQLLGEVSQVRSLFEDRSPLPPELISDVSYEEGRLDVTLAESAEGIDQAEQVCSDLSEAIQLPDLTITVHGPDGIQLASCEFGR